MPRAPDFRYRPRSRPMSGPVDPDLQSTRNIGARAGSRTLNLGIKRRLTFLARKRQDVSGRGSRTRWNDAQVPQSALMFHRLP